jgi:hypothetical protein
MWSLSSMGEATWSQCAVLLDHGTITTPSVDVVS